MKTNWKIDSLHSELRFEVGYLMISKISGYLTSYEASFQTDENGFKNIQQVSFTADSDSLNTNSPERDGHLKSKDFFDAGQYNHITFSGTDFIQGADETPINLISSYRNDFKLSGNLTIKDVTKPVVLDGLYGGTTIDLQGKKRVGFSFKLKLNRKDFDLSWGSLTESGKLILGEEVTVIGNCQFVKEL